MIRVDVAFWLSQYIARALTIPPPPQLVTCYSLWLNLCRICLAFCRLLCPRRLFGLRHMNIVLALFGLRHYLHIRHPSRRLLYHPHSHILLTANLSVVCTVFFHARPHTSHVPMPRYPSIFLDSTTDCGPIECSKWLINFHGLPGARHGQH